MNNKLLLTVTLLFFAQTHSTLKSIKDLRMQAAAVASHSHDETKTPRYYYELLLSQKL